MGEAEQRILKMLEEGAITAEEAEKLIVAISPEDSEDAPRVPDLPRDELPDERATRSMPDRHRFQKFWSISFIVALGTLLLSAVGLTLMYLSSGQVALIGFLCVWSIFIIALLVTFLVLLTRNAPWLHLRVKEKEGRRIAISLPIPLRLGHWGINVAKRFVPADQAANLEMAAMFMDEMSNNPDHEPLMIDVDDEDGDKVEIYLG